MKTRPRSSIAAFGVIEVIAAVAVAAWLGPKIAPKLFDSRTKEAAASANASAEVEAKIAKAVEAEQAKGAVVAASVQQIGVAAGQLPDSPQRTFIVRESGWVAPLLPPPDPAALLAAERRRVAILEGKIELADKLYATVAKENAALIARAAKAEARVVKALAERRAVDTDLVESAAYARGKDAVIGVLCALAALCGIGWFIARKTSLPKLALAQMANRAREGQTAMDVIDGVVPDTWHDEIERMAAKLRAREAAKIAARKAVL